MLRHAPHRLLVLLVTLVVTLPLVAQEPPEEDPGIIIDPEALEGRQTPEEQPPGEEQGGASDTSQEAVTIEILSRYPATSARTMLDQLVARGEKAVGFLETCLQDASLKVRLAAVEGLRRIGHPASFDAVSVAAQDRLNRPRLSVFADALITIDRPRGLAEVAGYLTATRSTLRRQARDSLEAHLQPEEAPELLEPYLKAEEGEARQFALELLSILRPGEYLDRCLSHLRDAHPGTAFAAATILARDGDERSLKQVHQLVVDGSFRSGAYATIALVLAEDRTGERFFQPDAITRILEKFQAEDQLDRGAAAIAMANLASWHDETRFLELLNRRVVPVLIETAGGHTYYPDHAVLRELVLRKLVYLTGRNFAFDWQAWRQWWATERTGFEARRGLSAGTEIDGERAIVRWTSRGQRQGSLEVLIGAYHDEDFNGEMIQLSRQDMATLVQNLVYEGLLDLPETLGQEGLQVGVTTIALLTEGRTRSVTRQGSPRGPKAEIFSRLEGLLAQVRYQNRWQRYHDSIAYPDPGEWWRTHYKWWSSEPGPEQASRRLRSMIISSLDLLQDSKRPQALAELGVVDGLCGQPVSGNEALLLAEMLGDGAYYGEVAGLFCDMIARSQEASVLPLALRAMAQVPSYDHQMLARRLLHGYGVAAARSFLTHPEEAIRAAAAEVLGELGGDLEDVQELLALRLEDSAPTVRAAAAHAVGQLGGEEGVAMLRPLLEDPTPFVRKGALRALGAIGGPRAVELILPHTGDPDRALRQSALLALGASGDHNAIYPLMVALLEESSPVGRQIAAQALASFPGEEARQALLERLRDEQSPENRLHLVETLAQMPDESVQQYFQTLARDEEGEIREAALLALGRMGDTTITGMLIGLLQEGVNPRALAVLRTLTYQDLDGATPEDRARAYSEWWQENQGRGWRWWLVEALVALGYPAVDLYEAIGGGEQSLRAVPVLIDALTEERPELRLGAARLLTELTGQDLGSPTRESDRLAQAVLAARWRQWYEEHVER